MFKRKGIFGPATINETLFRFNFHCNKFSPLHKKLNQSSKQINRAPFLWLHSFIDYQYSPYIGVVMGGGHCSNPACVTVRKPLSVDLIKLSCAAALSTTCTPSGFEHERTVRLHMCRHKYMNTQPKDIMHTHYCMITSLVRSQ